ncbi:hypothetical protein CAEBREN_14687 [Caenorhabditis brenneri]|uniref:7TM GPCR serpentine receptor class x (Srx) domain-containing protein n=1 Tax=Caenorhabditis brenneri TaxID=135651 RepID=G0NAM9_CAEBE|nr:hypothetical protein CAEBREN_14687 [Caenorhabditis brenneri]
MEESFTRLRVIAATCMLLTSIVGLILNFTIAIALFARFKLNSGFLVICMVKSMANNIICVGFLLWPVPVTYLNSYYLPSFYNVLAGQIIGWFAWSYSPTTQILLAGNRLMAVYFPQAYHSKYKYSPNRIFLSIIFILSITISLPGFMDGCNFIFELDLISWVPESTPCSSRLSSFFTYFAFSMSFISNTFNVIVFLKLVSDAKTAKISSIQHLNRQRRNRRMLFQSVCQDLIIAIDTFNTTYAWSFYSALWYQFIVCAYSRVLARTLEGLVMVLINEAIREAIRIKVFGKQNQKSSSETPASSSMLATHSKNIMASNRLFSIRVNN